MNQKRQFKRSTWVVFVLLAVVVIAAFCGIVFAAVRITTSRAPDVPLITGTVIYDSTGQPIQLTEDAMVSRKNGLYYLGQGATSIPLGPNTLAYTPDGVMIFGGGYRVAPDGTIYNVSDGEVFGDMASGAFFKLRDRRYAMAGLSIADTKRVFSTNQYLYISMDMVGNARLYSNEMSLKTTQPTVVKSGVFTFDIANEILTIGDRTMEVGPLIGTTNTYDSAIYKSIEETQTPDVIEVTIKGGSGGDGGQGGSGGDGGDGGAGGGGGDGGTGGTGGTGGSGGLGESQELVQILTLRYAKALSSTSIEAKYHFVDPFGSLGMVYLEAHEVGLLAEKGLTLQELYDSPEDDTECANYWASTDYKRTSITTYDSTYVFEGLKPDTEYYIVIGHTAVNSGTLKEMRYLDDYYTTMTKAPNNKLIINSVSQSAINITLHLESLDSLANPGSADSVGAKIVVSPDGLVEPLLLERAMIEEAVATGYTVSLPIVSQTILKDADNKQIIVTARRPNDTDVFSASCHNNFSASSEGGEYQGTNSLQILEVIWADSETNLHLIRFNLKLANTMTGAKRIIIKGLSDASIDAFVPLTDSRINKATSYYGLEAYIEVDKSQAKPVADIEKIYMQVVKEDGDILTSAELDLTESSDP